MEKVPAVMKGVQLIGHGGLDQLRFRTDIPVPKPGARDVLIRVSAAGVNNTDLNTRLAWYSKAGGESADASWTGEPLHFPRIQGADVCGEVVAIGDAVDDSLLHQRVIVEPCLVEVNGRTVNPPWYLGSECDGGFAEYTVVAARHAFPIQCALSDVELASFPCSYSTAENLLTRAHVQANEVVLVTGASGGVGSAVVQLAKARGARVIGVTSPAKADRILALGADEVVMRETDLVQTVGQNTFDVVVDLVAGPQWPALLKVLKPFGRYAAAGAIAGPLVELDVRTLYLKDLTLLGCTVLGETVFANLVRRIEAGEIRPLVADTFSLTEIPAAQTAFAAKKHVGKLVIDLSQS